MILGVRSWDGRLMLPAGARLGKATVPQAMQPAGFDTPVAAA
jgi:hypothetical protein